MHCKSSLGCWQVTILLFLPNNFCTNVGSIVNSFIETMMRSIFHDLYHYIQTIQTLYPCNLHDKVVYIPMKQELHMPVYCYIWNPSLLNREAATLRCNPLKEGDQNIASSLCGKVKQYILENLYLLDFSRIF